MPQIVTHLFGPEIPKTSRPSKERLIRKWIQEGRLQARWIKRGLYGVRPAHLAILKDAKR